MHEVARDDRGVDAQAREEHMREELQIFPALAVLLQGLELADVHVRKLQ